MTKTWPNGWPRPFADFKFDGSDVVPADLADLPMEKWGRDQFKDLYREACQRINRPNESQPVGGLLDE